jgi:hypothetical protein
MTKSNKAESCRELLKEMEILPFYSKYMFSLLMYVVKNNYLQRIGKFIAITLELQIIFTYQLLTQQNTKKEHTIWAARYSVSFPII